MLYNLEIESLGREEEEMRSLRLVTSSRSILLVACDCSIPEASLEICRSRHINKATAVANTQVF